MKREKMIILPQLNDCGGDILKKWFIYYSVRDARNGKMHRFKDYAGLHGIKDFKQRTQAAAEKCQELATKLLAGWTPFADDGKVVYADNIQYRMVADIYQNRRTSNRTFHFFACKFLEERISNKAPETLKTYRSKLRIFSMWLDEQGQGGNDITAITNTHVVDFFHFIIGQRKRSGNTTSKYKQILFAVFDFAIEQKALNVNPVYNLPTCKRINDMAARPVYGDDIQVFKERIQPLDPQLWMAIEFQFYTFIRPGNELRLLKIGDIDFARGMIYIDRENFKGRRENVKEIPEQFLKKLRNEYQLHTYNRTFYVFGSEGVPGPNHLGKNNLRFRFVKFRKALNMPDEYKLYSWKHTGGVMASEAGVPDKDISDQMGHTSLNTTSHYLKAKGGRRINSIRKNYPTI
jgi:integrase